MAIYLGILGLWILIAGVLLGVVFTIAYKIFKSLTKKK